MTFTPARHHVSPRTRAANTRRRALALPEVVAAVVVVAVLLSLLTVAGWRTRAQAMAGRDLANLRQVAGWTQSYVADSRDQLWGFWWKRGEFRSQWPDLNDAASDVQAAADQAVDILRRRAGRLDMPRILGWFAHALYTQLVLLDYVGGEFPDLRMVSAGDAHRMNWARNPAAFDRGEFRPFQPSPSSTARRWPYSASYQMPVAIFDQSPVGQRVVQGSNHSNYVTIGAELSAHLASSIAFPAQKVFLHDQAGWYGGRRNAYCAHPESRTAVLMADGSAGLRRTADSNRGWLPNSPTSTQPTSINYGPRAWEPPTLSGNVIDIVTGHYRWTRGGIEGIDFGGPEINTGQR